MRSRTAVHGCLAAAIVVAVAGCGESSQPAPTDVAACHFTVRGRWSDRARISYRIEDRGAAIPAAQWREQVTRACDTWSQAAGLTLEPAADGETPDVTFCWRRGHHGACEPFGTNSTVAHAGPVGPGSYVHFDADREWVADAPDDHAGYSLYGTALHELGHVLGLGHSAAEDAVMRTGVVRTVPLSVSDRFAMQSLYGGGVDAIGDVRIVDAQGRDRAVLRGVLPPGAARCACFDADGDGTDDVAIWRTDRRGGGSLMIYHFAAGAKLVRTTGPYYGVASGAAGAHNGVLRTEDGERLFVTRFANGRVVVNRFDEHALLHPHKQPDGADLEAAFSPSLEGDVDGDGAAERLVPVD